MASFPHFVTRGTPSHGHLHDCDSTAESKRNGFVPLRRPSPKILSVRYCGAGIALLSAGRAAMSYVWSQRFRENGMPLYALEDSRPELPPEGKYWIAPNATLI